MSGEIVNGRNRIRNFGLRRTCTNSGTKLMVEGCVSNTLMLITLRGMSGAWRFQGTRRHPDQNPSRPIHPHRSLSSSFSVTGDGQQITVSSCTSSLLFPIIPHPSVHSHRALLSSTLCLICPLSSSVLIIPL